jgi:hypothetical protein
VVGTLRREVLDRMLIFNARYLSKILTEYAEHHNHLVRISPAVSDRPPSKPQDCGRSPTWLTSAPSGGNRSWTA